MQAFKLYFKIFKKSALASTIMYFVIFSAIVLMVSGILGNEANPSFETEKYKVAVINNDNSEFSDELESYIKEHSTAADIKTDEQGIKDALFFRSAEYILTIPKGYGDAFENGEPLSLETRIIPNSVSGIFMDFMVNNYLKTYDLYRVGTEKLSPEQIVTNVKADLALETKVNLAGDAVSEDLSAANYYFNYTAYPFIVIMILSVSMVMLVMNEKDVKRRNLCSPINGTKFGLQIFLGNAALAAAIWILFCIYALILYKGYVLNIQGLFYFINSLVFMIVCLGLSFLVGNIASKNAINPISNILSLGCCFLGGAFVPQSMLSDTVKNIAVFNPVFWFIKSNNIIGNLSVFDLTTLKPVLMNMGIQLTFAAAFLAIALVIIKQKRTSN